MTPRKAIRVSTAAKMLDVVPNTVKRWIQRGLIEGFQLPSGGWRVYEDSVVALREGPDMESAPY